MNILYTVDKNYFNHMLTSIYSLLENNKNIKTVIHIIEDNINIEQIKLLNDIYNKYSNVYFKMYPIDLLQKLLDKYNTPKWRGSNVAITRLFAKEIIKDVDKILYLDSDTIIKNDLSDLFNKKVNVPISAVKEMKIPLHLNGLLDEYYNSGVILIDYTLWEKENYSKKIFEYINNLNIELLFPDQDIMNLAFKKEIGTLSADYNVFPILYDLIKYPNLLKKYLNKLENYYSYEEIINSMKQPHILHMMGYLYVRPWMINKVHPFNDIYEQYRKYWDADFEKIDNNSMLGQNKMIPFLNILMKSLLSNDVDMEIKNKIRKYTIKK